MSDTSNNQEQSTVDCVWTTFLRLADGDRYALISVSDLAAELPGQANRTLSEDGVQSYLESLMNRGLIFARGFPGTYSISDLGLQTQKLPAFTVDAKHQPREAAVSQGSTYIDNSTHHHTTNESTTINQSGANPQLQVASGNSQNSGQSRNDQSLEDVNAKLTELEEAFKQDLQDKDAALDRLNALQQTTRQDQVSVPEVKTAWQKFYDSLPAALGGQTVRTVFEQFPRITQLVEEIGSLIESYTSSGT